ncbi:hypothetical protein [Chryseobacterium sp. W4I1]|uniref:hypothetical protein n=1 Tax=Chryseobacterium sp. W4I1 TaxID=3042293 RepID=UPI002786D604|nr:hypothetical protein [Chryseobacterium sp. W4I1]MDQ0781354.1 hypothetical protein [Chryseobacterium sp. W4I1]
MTQSEHNEYDRLTHEMELHFIALTPLFMEYCENVIFGEEIEDLRHYCFHFYNDNYLSHLYQKLSYRIERLYKEVDSLQYPNLSDGFANLLIYLKEPIARENDLEYKAENFVYWRNQILQDPALAHNGSFRKYLVAL